LEKIVGELKGGSVEKCDGEIAFVDSLESLLDEGKHRDSEDFVIVLMISDDDSSLWRLCD
jgi:hypothetical protein